MKPEIFKTTLQTPATESTNPGLGIKNVFVPSLRIVQILIVVGCVLFLAHNVGVLFYYVLGYQGKIVEKIYARIDMNAEYNIPSLFSFTILLFSALLLYLISKIEIQVKTGNRKYWRFLSFIFLFLSFDEAFSVHEKFNAIKRFVSFGDSPFFKFVWILPYSLGVLVVGLFFLKFFFRLPKRTQIFFLIAGAFYCLSSIGFELIESYVSLRIESDALLYFLCGIEELIEMGSIILFIYALFDYLARIEAKISFLQNLNK